MVHIIDYISFTFNSTNNLVVKNYSVYNLNWGTNSVTAYYGSSLPKFSSFFLPGIFGKLQQRHNPIRIKIYKLFDINILQVINVKRMRSIVYFNVLKRTLGRRSSMLRHFVTYYLLLRRVWVNTKFQFFIQFEFDKFVLYCS